MYRNKSHRAPGSGSISKNPSGTYRAQVTIPSTVGGKPHRETRSFDTKREAEEWMRQRLWSFGGKPQYHSRRVS
jgi:hypothetical protein